MSGRVETLPRYVSDHLLERSLPLNVLIVVGASLLIAASAQVAIPLPFTPVPLTLQPLAIVLIGATLGSTRAFAAAALYLLEGASGLPVFANGLGGLPVLFGPSAGFLYAFPIAAAIAGFASERGWMRSHVSTALWMTLAVAALHISGWSWLAGVMGLGAERAFVAGNLPFLASDAIKVAIATLAFPFAQRLVPTEKA